MTDGQATPNPAAEAMWEAYCRATGTEGNYQAWAFAADDTPELRDELAESVRIGRKTATSSLLAPYEEEGEPLPKVGDHIVILDSAGRPVCITRTTWVTIRRFGDVDAAFAAEEGEGDLSYDYWRDLHIEFFAHIGRAVNDDTMLVQERFEVVWPPSEGFERPEAVAGPHLSDVPQAMRDDR
jgi:uncharacterized protein YhfF